MAPGPRVMAAKGKWDVEQTMSANLADGEGSEDLVEALDPDVPAYRYYESDHVLGKLYRAIDERSFLAEIQRRCREAEQHAEAERPLIFRLWSFVQRQISEIQWDHHKEWAYDVKEK